LIVLRITKPDAERPFRVPLGIPGLVVMTVLPVVCLAVALAAALSAISIYTNATLFALAAVATAPIAWLLVRPRKEATSGSSASEDSASN
jgi:membrane protein implicated in regulation of membrane protease activity